MPADPTETSALFRYAVIAEALNLRLGARERGRLVREIAARVHTLPDGNQVMVSRPTIDRWLRAYKRDGLQGLQPQRRSDQGAIRRHPELFTEAADLRRELPARSAAHIADILKAKHGIEVAPRTIRDQLRRQGLQRGALGVDPVVYGRYEAGYPNERWIGDVLSGPYVPYPQVAESRKAKLFLLVDDHSRLLVHGRWMSHENTRAGQVVLRQAFVKRGLPNTLYFDNGSPFITAPLERTCAVLGIRLIHSKPYSPQGRGKQERLNRLIRERFLLEAEAAGIADLDELNDRFTAWVATMCNTRVHAETGETPIARFMAGGPPRAADPALLQEAFRWSSKRTVTKTAIVSLAGIRYKVDPGLVRKRVELRYDPENMTSLSVYLEGRLVGVATPFVLGPHVHPDVPQAVRAQPKPTGIDYLGLVLNAHDAAFTEQIAYRELSGPDLEPLP
ncbi:MAG: transposase [Candidatus Dormibacteria bacterium]